MFIAVGATHGAKLFEGVTLTVRYFFDTLDAELSQSLNYRGLDLAGEVLEHPDYLDQARQAGREFAGSLP
jgi:hypothetical protein